ncbi:hypothetical protein SAMN06296241_3140 [Salinimicrobium sediminis]|uniref:Uncharacterized protein n=1 Tax=Salinimicrobium sediminis TaxID=1343891 RepID=A0A285X8B4_9FLAO|nr:hypothetical protein [Salinimicrobium sediminis]SOC81561.1 hypothetical protein SAMN06296241_3140 [Salinimicrobium sediminis]
MEEKFSSWLVNREGKLEATGRSYSRAINRLSDHYSTSTGIPIDIYNVDLELLKKIKDSYETYGRFSEFGYESHGLYRAAVKAYYRFRRSQSVKEPIAPQITTIKVSTKNSIKRKKEKGKTFAQKIIDFFTRLFQKKHLQKIPADSFVGTRKQISKHLISFINDWENEVQEKYLIDNPQCQRCKSMEFPEVVENPPILSKTILKMVLKGYPKKAKQEVLISDLESKFKSHVASGDRLMVLCRTCRQKDEARKVERYPHEMPSIMRQGPRELRY